MVQKSFMRNLVLMSDKKIVSLSFRKGCVRWITIVAFSNIFRFATLKCKRIRALKKSCLDYSLGSGHRILNSLVVINKYFCFWYLSSVSEISHFFRSRECEIESNLRLDSDGVECTWCQINHRRIVQFCDRNKTALWFWTLLKDVSLVMM